MTAPKCPEYGRSLFERDVQSHDLTVLRDDGLYRHLRYARPDTGVNHVDVITWPGHLHVGGDRDGYTFRRMKDMFEFFRLPVGGSINPPYWAEKITDGSGRAERHSPDRAADLIWGAVRAEYEAGGPARGLAKAVQAELFDPWESPIDYAETAHQAIEAFKFKPAGREDAFRFRDVWEWSMQDWDWHFLWSCHAITTVIARYDTLTAQGGGGVR